MRDYADAQVARQRRFQRLLDVFPGDAGVPDESDTIQRFVLVQKNGHPTGDGGYSYTAGDTFDEAVDFAGGEILDGWVPEGVYDLDTGEKIDVHVSSPVITRSEDQGATVNELDAGAVLDQADFVERHYDHIADTFTLHVTIDAGQDLDAVADYFADIENMPGVERFSMSREAVRQMITNQVTTTTNNKQED